MEEKILETVIVSFTKALIEEAKELFADIYDQVYDEAKQFLGKDLKNYLTKQRDKYSHIKTLLKGNTPVYLYDIYYPLKLENRDETILTNSISNLFTKSNYITIIGDAGSGKSTLVKHLFLNAIFEKYKIPLIVELRYLNNESKSLEEYIKAIITLNKISVNPLILDRFLENGKFVFFLDGYDELDAKAKEIITKQLNDFVNKYDKNNYILTSRPYSDIEHLPLFVNIAMKDLSLEDGDIKGFIYKQLNEELEIADKIIKSIEQGNSEYIESFLKNPLLLTLYILTFQSYASIPDKKYIFYRRVINALFSEHDSKTKLGFVREKLCGLNQEQFEVVLKAFSFISYFDNQFAFERDYVTHKLQIIKSKHSEINFDNNKFIVDLKSAIALWVDDNGELAFAHRSLQEYFAALFIKNLQVDENKRVYERIISRFAESKDRPMREMENLLSLLSEMDEFNYCQHYYLPTLKVLKGYFNDYEHTSRQFINFLTDGIAFYSNTKLLSMNKKESKDDVFERPDFRLLVKDDVNKTITVHIEYTRPLYNYIAQKFHENYSDFPEYYGICKKGYRENDYRLRGIDSYIIFEKGISDESFSILDTPELSKITDNYLSFLNREIDRVSNFLNKTINIAKDIVDLI